ncbi:MAG: protein kinase domain-containing protein [Planctomycetaceae bacterium]
MADAELIDDYEIVSTIATGNSTSVLEVRQKGSGQSFAMKLLHDEALTDPEQKKALKSEHAIGKTFDHPNLIRFYDLVLNKQRGYFVMEYFRSMNLKQMLRAERAAVQSRAKKILEGVALALAHMHEKNWVHKDLKPDNILATKGSEVKLIDFSLASRPSGALTKLMGGSKSMVIQGTRTYLAPELIRRKPLTFSVDIYSLGITLYEITTGRPPFIHGNPNELLMAHVRDIPDRPSGYNPNVTPEGDALIMRLIDKKPENRPKSMNDVAAELRSIKLFKEDPEEHARDLATKDKEKFDDSIAGRLDSRTDAARDKSAPPPPKPVAKPAPPSVTPKSSAPAPKAAAKPTPPPPPAAPPQGYPAAPPGYPPGYPMPQYPPGYPQQMPYYPGMPQAGMPPGMQHPGMPPQGWPQGYPPPQMPQGYPYPPGYPGAMPPGATVPGAVPPGSTTPPAPASTPPAAQTPPTQTPAAQTPPVAAPATPPPPKPAEKEEADDDLPMMTELPDIL